MVSFDKDKLSAQIDALKKLPQIKEVRALKQRLEKELEKLISRQVETKPAIPEIKISTNVRRSNKLSRYWRYVKLIRDNFPNLKTNEIRNQLKKRQQGQEVRIPDAIWQNPSP
jgi:hypothetical protein